MWLGLSYRQEVPRDHRYEYVSGYLIARSFGIYDTELSLFE